MLCIHNYKVSRNSAERFQRSCSNKKISSIFHFGQISKFKKAVTPRKKMESKFPADMHIYTLCPSLLQSFKKFCWVVSEELRLQTVLSSIFHFGQISKFKKGVNSEKKNWIKISCGYAHLHIMSFITTKFHEIQWVVSEELGWQEKQDWWTDLLTYWLTDWQTDWLMDGSKTL